MNTVGNYLGQANKSFPLDAEGFEAIQHNITLCQMLGSVLGDKIIVHGCSLEQGGTHRTTGYLFLRTVAYPNGEILYFEGGAVASGLYVKQVDIAIEASDIEYAKAYTVRTMAAGVGDENFAWAEFAVLKTPTELEQMISEQAQIIAALTPPPLGVIQMWAGTGVPNNYIVCDGRQLAISDYPSLSAILGTTYNTAPSWNGIKFTTSTGYFRVPDLRGRFVVGLNELDGDYSATASVGGKKQHALSVDELPAHDHEENLWAGATGTWRDGGNNSWPNATSHHNQTTKFGRTEKTGTGAAHESRPPFYTMQYIIRAK